MGKKKKKKKSTDGKKKKKKFKLGGLIKLVIFVLIVGSGVAMWQPELVKDEKQREQVLVAREKLLGFTNQSETIMTEKAQVLGAFSSAKDRLPKEVVIGDQEIYVDDVIQSFAAELETLPVEQFQRFKVSFCADLVASASATPE
jgi:hypothetical protein